MKKCVYTVIVDNYRPDICALSLPTIKAYAKRIGADFKIISERKFPEYPPTYEKTQVYELGKDNDWNILIDADMLIGDDFPDVTKTVPKDTLGTYMVYQADLLFQATPAFLRDNRRIGIASNFMVASKLCHDIWKPLEYAVVPSQVSKREFILDEYCFSLNLARFGMKITSLVKDERELSDIYHIGATTEPEDNRLVKAQDWINSHCGAEEKAAVVTIAHGDFYTKMGEITHPLMKAYADKIGAEFIVLTENNHSSPHYMKFDMECLLNAYNRIIYVDTDILVREDSPNLLEIVPKGQFAALNEGRFVERHKNMQQFIASSGGNVADWNGKYYNTGVMVFDRTHRGIFAAPAQEPANFAEQTFLNLRIMEEKPEVYDLSYKFNRMYCMDHITGEERHDCYFLHYAGVNLILSEKDQLKAMREDVANWGNNRKYNYKYKKHIAFFAEGGMGDQICAEPVLRFMIHNTYKGDDIVVFSNWPELFTHLGIPSYKHGDKIPNPGQYHIIHSLQTPDHPSWEYMSHPLMHGVDFSALQAIRMSLPTKDKNITLPYDKTIAQALSTRIGGSLEELILVHPGRGWDSKTLPSDVWQGYIDALIETGYKVAVIGKRISAEQGVVEVDTSKCIDLIDKLTIPELIALIGNAPVLISNDSAPIHIAGAFDNHVGLIATCKDAEKVLPYRKGSVFHKAKALNTGNLWEKYNHQPTQIDGATIDKCTEVEMRNVVPSSVKVVNFVKECFR